MHVISAIRQKLYDWWRYSRTIFLNVAVAILAVGTELLSFAAGFDWATLTGNPRLAVGILLGVNVLNIILRFNTTAPPGNKVG